MLCCAMLIRQEGHDTKNMKKENNHTISPSCLNFPPRSAPYVSRMAVYSHGWGTSGGKAC